MAEQNHLASTEWVDIVNENNEVIALIQPRANARAVPRHRATYIVVHDGMGKILVQRRTETKTSSGHAGCHRWRRRAG